MPNTATIHVPHLGGIDAAFQTAGSLDPNKPTLVLVNSFTTSSDLYKSQFKNKQLTDGMNLLAIELLGHGQTRCERENWTYWDTAIMNLQVLEELEKQGKLGKHGKVFVLGTSQGGWITVRMALLAPEKVRAQLQHI
jgi:pimeloyl-ACP methyl ester carboxylesterase